MEPTVTVNTSVSCGIGPDCAGVTPETSRHVLSSNGMSVVPCKDPCSLLHLPEPPMLKVLGYLSFRDILATAKTCTYLNQVITSEHLLAKRWFATLPAHQQNQFKEIARDISNPDLQNWLGQFTKDATVADKLCSQAPAEQTTGDDRKTCETQKRKYFPQVLFYTVSKLMAGCRQFNPVLVQSIHVANNVNTLSFNTHGDHLVIFRNPDTGSIFGYIANSPWHEQASFRFLSDKAFMTCGRHVLAWDEGVERHTVKIFSYNPDNSCTEQLSIVHEGKISSVDLSCDGHHAVITCDDGSARIYSCNDAGHWTLAADITDSRRKLKACFSPDGSRVLTLSYSSTKIHRRNEEGGWTLEAFSNFCVKSATFSPDGSHVLMSSYRGIAKILSLNKDGGWLESEPLTHNEGSVIRVMASPDGRHVITINKQDGENDSVTLKILSRDSNSDWTEKAGNIPIVNDYGINYWPKFSPDSCHVMVSKNESDLEILSCDKRGNWIPTSIPSLVRSKKAFFSPDSRHAAIIGRSDHISRIYSYDEARGWIESGIIPHDPCTDASFSPDSRHVVTFCWYQGILWDDDLRSKFKAKIYGHNGNGQWLPKGLISHAGPIYSACFNADGTHIVTASEDGTAVIFGRCTDGSWVKKTILRHTRRVNSAFFSVDSRQVVTLSGSHDVKIWRLVAAGRVLGSLPGTPQAATGQGVVLHTGNQKPEANRQN